jgi:PAS domain-containing protein
VGPGEYSGGYDRQVPPDLHDLGGAATGPAHDVGQFWYYFDDERWVWSDEVARIHGYQSADEVAPTTELLLQHKYPADRPRMRDLIHRMQTTKEPFSSTHRIVTVDGRTVPVMMIADIMLGEGDERIGTTGYYVVLADHLPPDVEGTDVHHAVHEQVEEVLYHRAAIEQAKGVLKFVYRLTDEQAFDLLRWRSQGTNTKIRDLAASICDRLPTVSLPPEVRKQLDHILLTAHESVDTDPSAR